MHFVTLVPQKSVIAFDVRLLLVLYMHNSRIDVGFIEFFSGSTPQAR